MKRSLAVDLFTCSVLGMAIGGFLMSAMETSNIAYVVLALISLSACVLNLICDPDKK